jgi:hypothetical protein
LIATVVSVSSRQLDASVGASGPHDFAVRISSVRQKKLRRPPHPAPNVNDDGQRPSGGRGMGESVALICPTYQAKYFSLADWTAIIALIPANKSRFA